MKDVGVGFYCFYIFCKDYVYFLKKKSQSSIKYEFTMPLFGKIFSQNYIQLLIHVLPVN